MGIKAKYFTDRERIALSMLLEIQIEKHEKAVNDYIARYRIEKNEFYSQLANIYNNELHQYQSILQKLKEEENEQ